MFRARKFKVLEKSLGYKFRDEDLLRRALTHSSFKGSSAKTAKSDKTKGDNTGAVKLDNERMEFIGDRVLGLAVSELLHESFPKANEGELARRFNKLVRGETCAIVGRAVGLGPFLILSDSEAQNGGRDKDTILADAIEAVLGAIFLDSSFEKARGVVRALWEPHTDQQTKSVTATADAKSALQEWAQGHGLPLPQYHELERTGPDHAPVFKTEVRIRGRDPATGRGASKRAAEQAAASALLEREGVLGGPASVAQAGSRNAR
jgi:ribonuclease III